MYVDILETSRHLNGTKTCILGNCMPAFFFCLQLRRSSSSKVKVNFYKLLIQIHLVHLLLLKILDLLFKTVKLSCSSMNLKEDQYNLTRKVHINKEKVSQ